jgi:periplasmic divalent cation tolerance protein
MPDAPSSSGLGDTVIDQKLAACANIFPIHSVFPWKGSKETVEEYVLILKTMPDLKTKLRAFVEAHHPYDTPCVISWDVSVNEKYGMWIKETVD